MAKMFKHILINILFIRLINTVTVEQFHQSLDMMRHGCAPKFKIPVEILNKLRAGEFTENNQDLKCYTKCVAQLAGTLTKKGELNIQKTIAQIAIILPDSMQDLARQALNACKDVQKNYKDSCDKVFYVTKCTRDFNPEGFTFP